MPTYVRSATDRFRALIAFLGKFPSYAKRTALANRIRTFIPVSLASNLSSKLHFLSYGCSRTTVSATDPLPLGRKTMPGSQKGTIT